MKLADLGTWTGGGTPAKKNSAYWTGGDVPWLTPKDMKAPVLDQTQDCVTAAALDGSAAKLVPGPSLAFVMRSGILERTLPIALVPFDTTVNQDMKLLSSVNGVSPDWLLYALLGLSEDIRQACRKDGTTVASIDAARLLGFEIAIPPRDEQDVLVEKINRQISTIADAERGLADASAALASFRTALLRDAFDEGPKVALGELAEIRSGLTKGRKLRGPTEQQPFLRAANVRAGHLDLTEVKTIPATQDERARYCLQPGDVLLVEGSGSRHRIGEGWLWEGQVDGCLHQNHVFCVRPDQARLDSRYLAWAVQGPDLRTYFHAMAKTTSGLSTLNRSQVFAAPVPLPDLKRQREIVHRLEKQLGAQVALAEALDHGVKTSSILRRSVLRGAATGAFSG